MDIHSITISIFTGNWKSILFLLSLAHVDPKERTVGAGGDGRGCARVTTDLAPFLCTPLPPLSPIHHLSDLSSPL